MSTKRALTSGTQQSDGGVSDDLETVEKRRLWDGKEPSRGLP